MKRKGKRRSKDGKEYGEGLNGEVWGLGGDVDGGEGWGRGWGGGLGGKY